MINKNSHSAKVHILYDACKHYLKMCVFEIFTNKWAETKLNSLEILKTSGGAIY